MMPLFEVVGNQKKKKVGVRRKIREGKTNHLRF